MGCKQCGRCSDEAIHRMLEKHKEGAGMGWGLERIRLGLMGKAECHVVQTEEPVQKFFMCWDGRMARHERLRVRMKGEVIL